MFSIYGAYISDYAVPVKVGHVANLFKQLPDGELLVLNGDKLRVRRADELHEPDLAVRSIDSGYSRVGHGDKSGEL